MPDFGFPSATGVFIPDHAASGNLITNFSRKPSTFRIGQWAAYTPVQKPLGYYLKLNVDACARVLDSTGKNTIWPPGGDAPQLAGRTEAFRYTQFQCERYADGWQLDQDEINNADWDIRANYDAIVAQRTMTQRCVQTIAVVTNTSNYDATHTATASSLGGGYLDQGTASNPIFKRALQTAFRRIHLDTRGSVAPSDLQIVMNPATANAISLSPEITDFVKNNQFGLDQLRGGIAGQNAQWGLPDRYSDFRIVVDDTVENTNPVNGTYGQNGIYAWPWATVALLSRPGALMAPQGGPSFSTVHLWLKEDMTVETMQDTNNRRVTSRHVNYWSADVVAPASGFIITGALATQPTYSLLAPDGSPLDNPMMATPQVFTTGINPDLQAKLDLLDSTVKRLTDALDAVSIENTTLREKIAKWETETRETETAAPVSVNQPNQGDRGRNPRR